MNKSILIILIILLNAVAFGQNQSYSKIYFVRSRNFFASNAISYIGVENQKKFELPLGGVVEYKIYSEGEISVEADYSGFMKFYCNLNVKRGKEYFVLLDSKQFHQVEEEKVAKFLKVPSSFETREEEIDSREVINVTPKEEKTSSPGQGTCFLVSSEGYFVTNYHCIENAKGITIRGIGNNPLAKHNAVVIASDVSNDLALIKINNPDLKFPDPPFSIRKERLLLAEKYYALGFFGSGLSEKGMNISEGIISSKTGLNNDVSIFLVSQALDPGTSGGPIIDENGNLIGVVYSKINGEWFGIKADYLETFLKNVEGFVLPVYKNELKDMPLPQKVETLKKIVFALEVS
ncbi:serine protease [Fluviicola sp.]|uniref:S1 family peptidase n=1 Tax=Fluviicola sp. TaxID=1917219 RepID=UPI0031DBA4A0